MKMRDACLPCIVNQVIKVAQQTGLVEKEALLKEVFLFLGNMNFDTTTPQVIGEIFEMVKRHTKNEDPYKETRAYYNQLFLKLLPTYEQKITDAKDSFYAAIQYAIIGNIIDFNPIHNTMLEDVLAQIEELGKTNLELDNTDLLKKELLLAKHLLYLGDNCGEICMDKLLLKQIKNINPKLQIMYGVRGKPVVNDSIAKDAYDVGIDEYAEIVSNGDGSLGTVLNRTSAEFKEKYNQADVIIAKGQANYECLSEENKNIYFLLMTKCKLIADDIGVAEKKMICMRNENHI